MAMICPICDGRLSRDTYRYKCPVGHSFDIAREGYVNLLLPKEAVKSRGDTRPMLLARRRFLDAGHYRAISTAVSQRISDLHIRSARDLQTVLEVGCGEGYYIGGIAASLEQALCFGVDISKESARLAAKRYRQVQFAVEDAKRKLLFEEDSVDAVMSVFAPRNPAEFARVLRTGGVVLVVSPEEHHLHEVRETFNLPLGIEADKTAHIVGAFSDALQLRSQTSIEYRMSLNQTELRDLVMMTPNAFHLEDNFIQQLEKAGVTSFETTVHCTLLEFCKAV
jgi:23S rRNA (guanine745-N1)-methyltransferase